MKLRGIVTKDSAQKTTKVKIVSVRSHKKYGKVIRVARLYLVHDPLNAAKRGQIVDIRPCVPVSKRKRWSVCND